MALLNEIYSALESVSQGMTYEELSKCLNSSYDAISKAVERDLEKVTETPFIEKTDEFPKRIKLTDFGTLWLKKKIADEIKQKENAEKLQKKIELEREEQRKKAEFELKLELKISEFFTKQNIAEQPCNPHIALDMEKFSEFFIDGYAFALKNPNEFLKIAKNAAGYLDIPLQNNVDERERHVNVAIVNIPASDHRKLSEVRYSKNHGKLMSFEAIVVVAATINSRETVSTFECQRCEERITTLQDEEYIQTPLHCVCGGRSFKHICGTSVDEQVVVLQEAEHSSAPVQIKAVLRDYLCDNFDTKKRKFLAGQKIRFIGLPALQRTVKYGKTLTVSEPYLSVHNYETMTNQILNLSPADIADIIEFSKKETCAESLNAMIAPHIDGYDIVKEAILLQLFGGVRTETLRGNVHILLDGDPSSGKTQILKHVINKLALKGEFSACSTASHIGLTATVRMDKVIGNYVVEAGSLVLANEGVLAIDELDKIKREDEGHLNNAMEDGSFKVDKANIHVLLPSDCAILAAANPRTKTETFTDSEDEATQINFSKTLISRFDLVFTFKDEPNAARDAKIADKVLRDSVKIIYPMSVDFFKKYLFYARQINPIISESGFEMIKKKYLSLREIATIERITPRDLSVLRRLSEASARMRLSQTVDEIDIKKAIRIYGYSMKAKRKDGKDEQSSETQKKRESIIKIVKELSITTEYGAPFEDVIERVPNSESDISIMKREGSLFESKVGYLKAV